MAKIIYAIQVRHKFLQIDRQNHDVCIGQRFYQGLLYSCFAYDGLLNGLIIVSEYVCIVYSRLSFFKGMVGFFTNIYTLKHDNYNTKSYFLYAYYRETSVMFKRDILVHASLFISIVSLGFGWYNLHKRQQFIEGACAQICDDVALAIDHEAVVQATTVERVVSSAQLWRPIQERVVDTVVQIFSQVAEVDLLQPYKTPTQGTASGSGFFINGDGDLITNAHVLDQASAVWIQIPSLGKRILDVEVVGVSPERDIALLRLTPESKEIIVKELEKIPFLAFGDSDVVRRSDEVMALGYPLGQQSLKSTTGVVSGHENRWMQTSAPLNPGNSGGPLLNSQGFVVGVNSAGIREAQNVGYAIPGNEVQTILPDLYKVKLLREPFLGIVFNNATDALTNYLGNPAPGGAYVVEVVKGSTLDKAGIQRGDMIYKINNHNLDIFGEMRVPWSEDHFI